MLLLGGLLLALLPWLGALRGAVLAATLGGGTIGGSWLAFARLDTLIDPTWPLAAVLAVYLAETAWTCAPLTARPDARAAGTRRRVSPSASPRNRISTVSPAGAIATR